MADPDSGLSNYDFIRLAEVFVKRWAELKMESLRKQAANFDSQPLFDQYMAVAYAHQLFDHLLATPSEEKMTEEEKLALFERTYGSRLGLPSFTLKSDVVRRLEWLKRAVTRDFEASYTRLLDRFSVTSPIEQLFLMEWQYQRMDEQLGVSAAPQHEVPTQRGNFVVDLLIKDRQTGRPRLIVELDGHDFHEKTKEQVAADKSRERAIVRSGIRVMRFSGSEVFRNTRACVVEVADFLKTTPLSP
jgi:very-short-patch-repair endonuclease